MSWVFQVGFLLVLSYMAWPGCALEILCTEVDEYCMDCSYPQNTCQSSDGSQVVAAGPRFCVQATASAQNFCQLGVAATVCSATNSSIDGNTLTADGYDLYRTAKLRERESCLLGDFGQNAQCCDDVEFSVASYCPKLCVGNAVRSVASRMPRPGYKPCYSDCLRCKSDEACTLMSNSDNLLYAPQGEEKCCATGA